MGRQMQIHAHSVGSRMRNAVSRGIAVSEDATPAANKPCLDGDGSSSTSAPVGGRATRGREVPHRNDLALCTNTQTVASRIRRCISLWGRSDACVPFRVGLWCALGGQSGHVALAQLIDPFRVVAERPVFADPAAGDRAERVSSTGMDQGEVEVAEQEEEGDVHQPVVHDQRVLESEGVVALAVPEEEAGDGEENREGGGDDRVDFLTGVEAALCCTPRLSQARSSASKLSISRAVASSRRRSPARTMSASAASQASAV